MICQFVASAGEFLFCVAAGGWASSDCFYSERNAIGGLAEEGQSLQEL